MNGTTRRCLTGLTALFLAPLATPTVLRAAEQPARPNILWLVSEDNDCFLGCYGDRLAHTPTLDNLARQGVLYEHNSTTCPTISRKRTTSPSSNPPAQRRWPNA